MASRKTHIAGGVIIWLITFLLYYFVGGLYMSISIQREGLWLMASFLLCILGAEMADFDNALWQKIMPHRHMLTHSIFLPALVCIPLAFVKPDTMVFVPLYAFFLLGYSTHLLLDLHVTNGWQGTALIKFWWVKGEKNRSMGKHLSKFWLLLNGCILFVFGVILLFTYTMWII